MIKNTLFMFMMALVLVACGGKQEATDGAADGDGKMADDKKMAAVTLTDGTYAVVDGSMLNWKGSKKIGKNHTGTIDLSTGEFTVEGGTITAGSFEVDMSTITDTDLTAENGKEKLEGHLSGPDFFNAPEFPTASFEITNVTALEGVEGATHKIEGDFTLKGTTNPISFNAMVSEEGNAIMTKAKFTFDRAKWNVEYGSTNFFKDLAGDKIINNEIEIDFNLKAEKAEDVDVDTDEGADADM